MSLASQSPQSETEPAFQEPAGVKKKSRRTRLPRWADLEIQSKLLVMLCTTAILCSSVVGFVGYQSGTDALEASAYERLTEVRNSRAREMTRLFDTLKQNMVIYTRGTTVNNAAKEFTDGFKALQNAEITAAEEEKLTGYYESVFITSLNANMGTENTAAGFLPTSNAQRYLQLHYTAPFTDFDEAVELDDAGDGSAWSAAHVKYQDYFRQLTTRFNYEDALILDTEGNVVYTAYSGVDLGTNINSGPFQDSSLGGAYQKALASNDSDYVAVTDLERYQPSYGVPTGWAVSPIGQAGKIVGVLALQLPIASINEVMTGDGNWKDDGLGATGETYLAGPDSLMRSTSRFVLEDPAAYEQGAVDAGLPQATAAKAVAVKGTVLIQTVRNTGVDNALEGKSGTTVEDDYLGQESLIAYAPIAFADLQWVIVAKISADEIFAPVADLTRRIILSTLGIIFIVCLASLLLAQVFARPVRRLLGGVHEVAAGNVGTQVDARSSDEFGELSAAFNSMSRSLQIKQQLLDDQLAENDRLLLSIMPEAVAARYRQGEETIAEDHQDVTVIFAEIIGFEDYTSGTSSVDGLSQLNNLVRTFDDAATTLGVEKVRTMRNGYLASCGLTVPRIDHARRIVDFALEMQEILNRFNAQHSSDLRLRAGVDTGTVSSGLVGRSSVVYDLWGDAVNLAYRVRDVGGASGVFVSSQVSERLTGSYTLADAGEINSDSGSQRVWSVTRAAS